MSYVSYEPLQEQLAEIINDNQSVIKSNNEIESLISEITALMGKTKLDYDQLLRISQSIQSKAEDVAIEKEMMGKPDGEHYFDLSRAFAGLEEEIQAISS